MRTRTIGNTLGMPPARLHADEVHIDELLARRLLAEQLPSYRSLPLRRVASGGTENAVFRLGDDFALRMPLTPGAVGGLLKEIRWLPVLRPHLSLKVPEVVATGKPSDRYPFPWAVVRWLPGDDALTVELEPMGAAADALGRFVSELRTVPTAGAPAPGTEGFTRGLPLTEWDADVREALARCDGLVDVRRVTAVWDDALAAPTYQGPPVWLHADLIPGNIVVRAGRVAGVLDFGGMAIGDPAYDVTPAWHLLDSSSRLTFLDVTNADQATCRRARGIVVALGAFALPYYQHTNPAMMRTARRGIAAVLQDAT